MIVRWLLHRGNDARRRSRRWAYSQKGRFPCGLLSRVVHWANSSHINRRGTNNLKARPRVVGIPHTNSTITRTRYNFIPDVIVSNQIAINGLRRLTRQTGHSIHCLCDRAGRSQRPCPASNDAREPAGQGTFSSSLGSGHSCLSQQTVSSSWLLSCPDVGSMRHGRHASRHGERTPASTRHAKPAQIS